MIYISDEIKVQTQRENHIETVKEYMNTHCDLKGNVRDSMNLNDMELKGMRQVKEGIESKGWYLYQTDKSGRMCLGTVLTTFSACRSM